MATEPSKVSCLCAAAPLRGLRVDTARKQARAFARLSSSLVISL
jgi:hypothetical protein